MAGLSLSLPDERQQLILGQLARNGRVLAIDLARQFGVSEDTARRDLRELSAAGFCRRVYGGALKLSPATGTLVQRDGEHSARKAVLGQAAAALIAAMMRPGQVLFLDASSTNLAIARALPPRLDIIVATNAPHVAAALMTIPDIELVLIGGRVDRHCGAALGMKALRDLEAVRVDLAFLGACALDPVAGLATFSFDDAAFKRAVAQAAGAVAAAVTSDKLNTSAPFAIMPASLLTHLVVEADAPEPAVAALAALGVKMQRAAQAEGKAQPGGEA